MSWFPAAECPEPQPEDNRNFPSPRRSHVPLQSHTQHLSALPDQTSCLTNSPDMPDLAAY